MIYFALGKPRGVIMSKLFVCKQSMFAPWYLVIPMHYYRSSMFIKNNVCEQLEKTPYLEGQVSVR